MITYVIKKKFSASRGSYVKSDKSSKAIAIKSESAGAEFEKTQSYLRSEKNVLWSSSKLSRSLKPEES